MIYACSDLHGQYELWEQIKNYLKPEDTLYFLGDAADRGTRGFDIMMELLDMDNVIYIRGNHDEMFEHYLKTMIYGTPHDGSKENWMYNGGRETLERYNELHSKGKIFPIPLYNKMQEKLINYKDIKINNRRIILSHAGVDADKFDNEQHRYEKYPDLYYWDRGHIRTIREIDESYKNTYVIHGHTPVATHYFNEPKENPKMVKYTNNKICIDMGSFFTGRACLLNLETLEPTYFNATPVGDWI